MKLIIKSNLPLKKDIKVVQVVGASMQRFCNCPKN